MKDFSEELQIVTDKSTGKFVIENAKDRFIKLLNSSNADTFECIVTEYIQAYGDTISADQCSQIIQLLAEIQCPKIAKLNRVKRIASEHANYLVKYLDGKLYTEKDSLEKYKDIQKNNAQAIIDVCNE